MTEAVALCWLYLASALCLLSEPRRGLPPPVLLDSAPRTRAARLMAALLVLAAGVLHNAHEPGPAAFIAVPVALMATSTLVTLLAPLGPRVVWGLAVAALPLSILFAALGALFA